MPDRVALITVDVSRTLGIFTGRTTSTQLADLTPLAAIKPNLVGETVRSLLYRAPELTPDLASRLCDQLLIPRDNLPTQWHRGYEPYPHAQHVLEELAQIAPVVALSNMSVTGGPERVAAIKREHGHTLTEVYASFLLGGAKPERWLWHVTAGKHQAEPAHVVHIGDQLAADVYGAWAAGARVIHLRTSDQPVDYPADSGSRIASVHDLADAVPLIRAWAAGQPVPDAAAASPTSGGRA
ncbi:HAD family hydrolase [Amycolatopsis australiensis]|uniref:Haloacid dehalogenase-like hydrolase n=1 Tax=Amycolatopsis australiensis TaxID=546364 RepID=A0A1K1LSJ6_9PSEU|nr:HAD family hydrolase [Amycolatopsis australiensis]SFW13835.1 Haloacid dehalogenase-like hydrolase [Amycolatopsis australiensis]